MTAAGEQRRVALVTGATSGIGAATARGLAADGFTVVLVARRERELTDVAAEVREAGGRADVVVADVSEPEQAVAAVTGAVERHGRLDLLVNSAGVGRPAPVRDADHRDWELMLRTNTLAPMVLSQAALPALVESQGTVLIVSSASGRRAVAGNAGYVASKFALTGFAESLRQEVAEHGVRVCLVEPGFVDTPMIAGATLPADLVALRADDVAAAIRYVAAQPEHVAVNEVLLRPAAQRS